MRVFRWFTCRHRQPDPPMDTTGPATSYGTRSGAYPNQRRWPDGPRPATTDQARVPSPRTGNRGHWCRGDWR